MKKTLLSLGLASLFVGAKAQKFEWASNMGGSLSTVGTSIAVDNLNNVYTVGTFNGVTDLDPSNLAFVNVTSVGNEDIFITKFNSKGEYVWGKSIGGTGSDLAHHLKLDAAGNLYIIGSYEGSVDFDPSASGTNTLTAKGSSDMFIMKMDVNGNLQWAKSFGGNLEDKGIALTIQGSEILATGYFKDSIQFDASVATSLHVSLGGADVCMVKLDLSGNYLWSGAIGGISDEEGKSVSIDKSGNMYIAGFFNGSVNFNPSGSYYLAAKAGRDAFLIKLDKNGAFLWAKITGGNGFDGAQTVIVDAVKNIYTIGYFSGFVDFDPSSSDAFLNSGASSAVFVQKLDSNGQYQWAKSFNATLTSYSQSATIDIPGNIYLTGYFSSPIDFGTGSGLPTLNSSGFDDAFIMKIYPSGKYASVGKISGTKYENGFAITMDNKNDLYATGQFSGTTDFDPGATIANLAASPSGISDAFVTKWSNFPSSIEEQENIHHQQFRISPNPANKQITISLFENTTNSSIVIYNSTGQQVYYSPKASAKNIVDVQHFASGFYFVQIMQDGQPIGKNTIIIKQ